jgi:hypothetical protein
MTTRVSALALAAAVSLAALPAHAKTVPQLVTATYSGLVGPGGEDDLGIFGPTGGHLDGMPFTATFALNERSPGFGSYISSGLNFASGPGDETLTINGYSVSFNNVQTYIDAGNDPYIGEYAYSAYAQEKDPISNSLNTEYSLSMLSKVPALQTGTPDYHKYLLNGLVWKATTFDGFLYVHSQFFTEDIPLYLSSLLVTSVRAPKPSGATPGISFQAPGQGAHAFAVPEPGAWTMMLLGVGALGAMGRRRRKVMAA